MGLWQKWLDFRQGRQEKSIAKYTKVIKNPKAMKEDRWAALEYFKGLDDAPVSTESLLQRFEYSLEHGINDTREKDIAMEGITRHGQKSLPTIENHLKKTSRIAWPIKALAAIADEQKIVAILLGLLNFGDISFDRDLVDKNYDVLCYLRDYKFSGAAERLGHFLKDPDERVRFAAVEVLVEQDDKEIPSIVEHFLADESAENRRIRRSVIDAFVKHGWQLKNPDRFATGVVDQGIFVNKKGTLEQRV